MIFKMETFHHGGHQLKVCHDVVEEDIYFKKASTVVTALIVLIGKQIFTFL